jgi:hypothetical protein
MSQERKRHELEMEIHTEDILGMCPCVATKHELTSLQLFKVLATDGVNAIVTGALMGEQCIVAEKREPERNTGSIVVLPLPRAPYIKWVIQIIIIKTMMCQDFCYYTQRLIQY